MILTYEEVVGKKKSSVL